MIKNIFACMDENTLVYTVGLYKNHAFRVFPDGTITRAEEQEQILALKLTSRN